MAPLIISRQMFDFLLSLGGEFKPSEFDMLEVKLNTNTDWPMSQSDPVADICKAINDGSESTARSR